jgi:membrane-bound ClpP family serine protease
MANATYTGARRVADFWILSHNKATKQETYEAFALFIVDKAILNNQIAENLENIITKNKELSAAEIEIYRAPIAKIQSRGLLG